VGYKVEDKLHLGLLKRKRLNTTALYGVSEKSFTAVFHMLLCGEHYETYTHKGVQTIHCSRCSAMDSLYAFKYKRFRNTRHTATFGIQL
jgi:hypothetical protein